MASNKCMMCKFQTNLPKKKWLQGGKVTGRCRNERAGISGAQMDAHYFAEAPGCPGYKAKPVHGLAGTNCWGQTAPE